MRRFLVIFIVIFPGVVFSKEPVDGHAGISYLTYPGFTSSYLNYYTCEPMGSGCGGIIAIHRNNNINNLFFFVEANSKTELQLYGRLGVDFISMFGSFAFMFSGGFNPYYWGYYELGIRYRFNKSTISIAVVPDSYAPHADWSSSTMFRAVKIGFDYRFSHTQ